MKRSTQPHSHHPCRQPDPAAGFAGFPARQAGRQALRRDGLSEVPDRIRSPRWCASRPKPASTCRATASSANRSAGRNMRWSGCPASSAGRSRTRPPIRSSAAPTATRFPEFYAELDAREGVVTVGRCDLHRPDQIHRAGRAAARHRQFQSRAQKRESGRGVPAGGGAGERHPRPQERILQDGRGFAGGDRRGHAHRIQDDRRRRLPGAARRCAQCGDL